MQHEAWITGIGIITALGAGYGGHAAALRRGHSGLGRHRLFDGREPDPCVCGMVPQRLIAESIDDSAADRADRLLDFALKQALSSAGLRTPVHADIIAGTTLGNMHGATLYYKRKRENTRPDVGLVRHFLPYSPVEWVASRNGVTGRHVTVCSACASAHAALGQALRRIRGGQSTRVCAGGFEALSPFAVAGFNSLRLMSDSPCRPFDRSRNGLNPGEGAAVLVVERADVAQERGARPLAVLAGFGEALEAYHYTRSDPSGSGTAAALQRALAGAGIGPEAIGHLHLHGTATEVNDRSEYAACRDIFGPRLASIPACSTKSMTGHTLGAAGALNAVFSIISLNEKFVPATLNFECPDPEFEGLRISASPVEAPSLSTVASSALGFGGEASAVIFSQAVE